MNALLQESAIPSKQSNALHRLNTYIEDLYQRKNPIESLEVFEREMHQLTVGVEQEIVAEGLSQFDIQAKVVEAGGQVYRNVLRIGKMPLVCDR